MIRTQRNHLASSEHRIDEHNPLKLRNKQDIESSSSSEQIEHHASTLLIAVRQACTIDSVIDPRRLLMCAALVADEELPQAARWHRRDLAPGLIAAWRAVLRTIAPPPGYAAAHAAAQAACKET